MKTFNLTDPGEGLTEAEIITWRVAEGDTVKVNDIVVEVETSKSLVELPIPWAGTVAKILVSEGDTVEVGAPIITIDDGETDAEKEKRTPNLVGYGPTEGSTKRRARRSAAGNDPLAKATHDLASGVFGLDQPVGRPADTRASLPAQHAEPSGDPLPSPGEAPRTPAPQAKDAKVLAKPPVRKLAKDLGIDLTQVSGSGEGGIVSREDVLAHQGRGSAPVAAVSGAGAGGSGAGAAGAGSRGLEDRRVPVKGVRKMTAQAMVDSAFTAPHVTEWITIDVTATMELLERLKARREFADVRLSPLVLVARACLIAMGRNPELNSAWDETAQEIVYRGSVNLGIAAATPRGLVVPNIKGADALSLLDLANALTGLVQTAKGGRTQPADMAEGTFTITNVGVFGVDAGTPILNPGEAGILAMGAIDRRPWVVGTGADERIEPRWVTTLALSFDHRLVDGEQGSKFLADVAMVLRDPGLALLF